MSIFGFRLKPYLLAICLGISSTGVHASQERETARICEQAAVIAARESGVPLDVLRAISLTETGRKGPDGFLPWPWTVNMEGIGKWFADPDKAKQYVDEHFARGARSFDVGCFQINYRWHGKQFDSIEAMFDPVINARYAARFLSELYDEMGDWSKAAGAYHSRTPKYAKKYTKRFEAFRAKFSAQDAPGDTLPALPGHATESAMAAANPNPAAPRVNRYPLLQGFGGARAPGSLVPIQGRPTPASPLIVAQTAAGG